MNLVGMGLDFVIVCLVLYVTSVIAVARFSMGGFGCCFEVVGVRCVIVLLVIWLVLLGLMLAGLRLMVFKFLLLVGCGFYGGFGT